MLCIHTLILNQHLRNIELQHCEYYAKIEKCTFNVEKTLQKHLMFVEIMSYRRCNSTLIQHKFNIYSTTEIIFFAISSLQFLRCSLISLALI